MMKRISILVAIVILSLITLTGCSKPDVKVTVYWQGHYTTFDTKYGDEVKVFDEDPLPVRVKIDGEWHSFGYSLIDKIIYYEEE